MTVALVKTIKSNLFNQGEGKNKRQFALPANSGFRAPKKNFKMQPEQRFDEGSSYWCMCVVVSSKIVNIFSMYCSDFLNSLIQG